MTTDEELITILDTTVGITAHALANEIYSTGPDVISKTCNKHWMAWVSWGHRMQLHYVSPNFLYHYLGVPLGGEKEHG